MGKGREGTAGLYGGAQAGLVRGRDIPQPGRRGTARLPLTELRASFQRTPVPEPPVLPVPDQDDEGADADAEQLLVPVPGLHPPQRGEPRHGGALSGCRRAVRPHRERHGAGTPAPSSGRRDYRHGGKGRAAGEILLPVAGGHGGAGGHRTGRRGGAHRRQAGVGLYALGTGRAAGQGGHGQPLRAALDRPLGLPPLVRQPGGAAAAVQPPL